MMTKRATVVALIAVLAVPFATASARAQDWPTRPVRILAPFTAGGTADILGRLVAQKVSDALGQNFVVENRTGGAGLIAAELIAKAPPDGYNLIVSGIGGFIIATAVAANPPVDPLKDFTHIAMLGGPPSVLVVTPDMPARSLKDLVDMAKKNPGAINYGSPSAASHSAMVADLFQQQAGIRLTHIPYKGASQAMTDMLGGHLPAASMTLTSAAGQLDAKKIRALAVSSPRRVADYPDIPTYAEQGFPEIITYTWFALSGPANMPAAIVSRLNAEVVKALAQPDVQARLQREAIYTEPFTSTEFTAFFKREIERWAPLAKASSMQENAR
jgi:tripartite-type tricarboxylate transporter receptor subunit TctC